MAFSKSEDPGAAPKGAWTILRWATALVILGVFVLGHNTNRNDPGNRVVVREISIPVGRETDWIDVPEGWSFRVKDESGAAIEVRFWDGRVVTDANPTDRNGPAEHVWAGRIRNCSFKVRRVDGGRGVAVLTLYPS